MKHATIALLAGIALMACTPSSEPALETPAVEPAAVAPVEPAPPVVEAPADTCRLAQYASLIPLLQSLKQAYPIRAVVGHSEIAPGRKTDPGVCFEWERVRELVG